MLIVLLLTLGSDSDIEVRFCTNRLSTLLPHKDRATVRQSISRKKLHSRLCLPSRLKPWVDVGILFKCLEKHKALVTDMGSYEPVNSQSAPNATALLDLKALWGGLLELSPCGSIHSQPLRQALISLLSKEPDVNSGKHSGGVWANLKIERINCMLKHVRQFGRNRNSLGLAVSQLTRLEYQSLLAGLEKLEVSTDPKKDEQKDAEAEEEEEPEERLGKVNRKLKPHNKLCFNGLLRCACNIQQPSWKRG